jgi:hypothetical protein
MSAFDGNLEFWSPQVRSLKGWAGAGSLEQSCSRCWGNTHRCHHLQSSSVAWSIHTDKFYYFLKQGLTGTSEFTSEILSLHLKRERSAICMQHSVPPGQLAPGMDTISMNTEFWGHILFLHTSPSVPLLAPTRDRKGLRDFYNNRTNSPMTKLIHLHRRPWVDSVRILSCGVSDIIVAFTPAPTPWSRSSLSHAQSIHTTTLHTLPTLPTSTLLTITFTQAQDMISSFFLGIDWFDYWVLGLDYQNIW